MDTLKSPHFMNKSSRDIPNIDMLYGLPNFNLPKKNIFETDDYDYISDIEYVNKLKCNNKDKCEKCNTLLMRRDSQYCICNMCGIKYFNESSFTDQQSNDLAHSYNINDNSHISFKIIGSCKSVHIQNIKLMGMTSDYNVTRTKHILRKINSWIYQIEGDSIPNNVCRDTAETYSKLQETECIVKRAGGLNGVLASLLYNKCIEYGIPKKPKIIATITGIRDNQLSDGDKILRQLAKTGAVKIPEGYGEYSDFIDQYFEKLGLISYIQYKQFIIDLITASDIKYIKISSNNARPTTRCAGCIYILCQQLNLDVSRDKIADECNISKSTFARFVNMIYNYKKKRFIQNVFNEHEIPLL